MVLNFKPITVSDKETITAFTSGSPFNNCDFAFANMCSWRFLYESEFAVADEFLFLRFYVEDKGRRHLAYMFPLQPRHCERSELPRHCEQHRHCERSEAISLQPIRHCERSEAISLQPIRHCERSEAISLDGGLETRTPDSGLQTRTPDGGLQTRTPDGGLETRTPPASIAEAIAAIERDAAAAGYPLLILGVTPEIKNTLQTLYPNAFTIIPDRNYYDYIYLRDDLLHLTGKKYQPKRNHINRFRKLYDYQYIPLTREMAPQCMALEQQWFKENEDENDRQELLNERRSMCFALQHFEQLGLTGGAILVESKIVAFTYGSPINHNTFGVHVEKADVTYDGVFSVINQEFAAHIPENFTYINREEDLGIAGLRQSKLSYNPFLILEKNVALKRR
jgi:hypothetical protein